jgi:hypothetical protein
MPTIKSTRKYDPICLQPHVNNRAAEKETNAAKAYCSSTEI